jgi:uncharacterized protein YraI
MRKSMNCAAPRKAILAALAGAMLATGGAAPALAADRGTYEVHGVGEDDLLRMRAGPGTGYRVILGVPDGTVVRVIDCTQTGGTRWCKATLDQFRDVRGYLSFAYLKKR